MKIQKIIIQSYNDYNKNKAAAAHRIGFKANIPQNQQSDSFQSSQPKKIYNFEVIEAFKKGDINSLIKQEELGKTEKINWNVTDSDGDNLLMMYFRRKYKFDWYDERKVYESLQKLANEGKIDVNYINKHTNYSLAQYAIKNEGLSDFSSKLMGLKNLDLTKTGNDSSIVKYAIAHAVSTDFFEEIVCHPSINMSKYDLNDLYNYMDKAPKDIFQRDYDYEYRGRQILHDYTKRLYKSAIETALKVENARKGAKYYKENGSMTLNQIQSHVNNTCTTRAINLPLTDLGGTIAHLLAETYVDPKDEASVKKVSDIITEMRCGNCYFWKEDALGRSPLMLALENQNIIVAKAMLEKMTKSEFQYYDISQLYIKPFCAINDQSINHIPVLWNLIADLTPKDRKVLGPLFIERIKSNR